MIMTVDLPRLTANSTPSTNDRTAKNFEMGINLGCEHCHALFLPSKYQPLHD